MFGPKEMVDKVLALITNPKQMATDCRGSIRSVRTEIRSSAI